MKRIRRDAVARQAAALNYRLHKVGPFDVVDHVRKPGAPRPRWALVRGDMAKAGFMTLTDAAEHLEYEEMRLADDHLSVREERELRS